eukprot:3174324-Amphidinium_carterae.1
MQCFLSASQQHAMFQDEPMLSSPLNLQFPMSHEDEACAHLFLETIGALFAIYWICRLDIDGRKGMAFGTDPSNMHKARQARAASFPRVADIPSGLTPESIKE